MIAKQKQEVIGMREAIRAAVNDALNEVGLAAFKRTSLFMSSRAPMEVEHG